jgi:uncharacterized protein YcsI (UPF0317 family)
MENHGPTAILDQTSLSSNLSTGLEVRKACLAGYAESTSGLAPTYLQANLIILPSQYTNDFRGLCRRNPVPCPLLAESKILGSYHSLKSWINDVDGSKIASSLDLRKDAPSYNVYKDGKLIKEKCQNIVDEWTDDHVAFLIGCSFSFESALAEAGLVARHTAMNRVTPMYRTNIPLCKSGVFNSGTYVVSMRPYKRCEIEAVRNVTRGYAMTHGEPIAWGWDAVEALGIVNIDVPDWGEAPFLTDCRPLSDAFGDDDNIPVFWGCGVTPQEAVMSAGLEGTIMSHTPAHMLVLDCRDWDIVEPSSPFKP